MYRLYKITNIVDGKSYIGFTKMGVQQRWAAHINSSKNPKYPIHYAIAKHGVEKFTVDTLVIGSRQYITALEEPAIQAFNSRAAGYNVALGGCGGDLGPAAYLRAKVTRSQWPQSVRDRISAEASARRAGKTYLEIFGPEQAAALREQLAQLQIARGGYGPRSHSAETKRKIGHRQKGKTVPESTRQKIRETAKLHQAGKRFAGRRASCLCCRKEWDIGNFTQHTKRNSK